MTPAGFALSAILFASYLALHWPITAFCDGLVQRFGFAGYQRAVATATVLLGAGALLLARRRARLSPDTWRLLLGLTAFILLAQPTLVLINIENIHFPQYALLAAILMRAGLAAEPAWGASTALGAADEAYQYLFLVAGRPDRLDWNDITFNAVGAALGVGAAMHAGAGAGPAVAHRTATIPVITLSLVAVAGFLRPPDFSPFYATTPHGLQSHELTAGEGLLLIGALWWIVHHVVQRLGRRAAAGQPRAEAAG